MPKKKGRKNQSVPPSVIFLLKNQIFSLFFMDSVI